MGETRYICIEEIIFFEEFGPVKNATGIDSPETAKKIYETFWNNKIKK